MSASSSNSEAHDRGSSRSREYVVVARRYRPQTFEELVGQEHVAKALSNAIATSRVGHAYLFTGARGVGKTSAARILAKALNCETGPTPQPCNRCDVCESISSGEDVDVLEIDGASNRGIDEIRQLRQNVNIRPSRERFKIYIIDEVHMLTGPAFNALLKTLEEPPEHVKFIFCTTEPAKIPVTILSRCQRFDFAGIHSSAIARRLEQIIQAEGVTAEREAIQLLARRAAGSMRDSQSLLEQLLAFAPERITVADVNAMLGTAGADRLGRMVESLVAGHGGAALHELDAAMQEGVDPGLLIEQLLGFYRDVMVAAAGCPADMFLYLPPEQWPQASETAASLGLESVLAAMQILDQTLSRMRYSTQGRILAELALVRIATLGDMEEIGDLVAALHAVSAGAPIGGPALAARAALPGAVPDKKKVDLTGPAGLAPGAGGDQGAGAEPVVPVPITSDSATEIWTRVAGRVPGLVGEHARHFCRIATPAPNRLVVGFRQEYTLSKSVLEAPEQRARFEQILRELTGGTVHLEFELVDSGQPEGTTGGAARAKSGPQRRGHIAQHPMVRRAVELFGAFPDRVEEPRGSG